LTATGSSSHSSPPTSHCIYPQAQFSSPRQVPPRASLPILCHLKFKLSSRSEARDLLQSPWKLRWFTKTSPTNDCLLFCAAHPTQLSSRAQRGICFFRATSETQPALRHPSRARLSSGHAFTRAKPRNKRERLQPLRDCRGRVTPACASYFGFCDFEFKLSSRSAARDLLQSPWKLRWLAKHSSTKECPLGCSPHP
jgi:hypothetical protein